MADSFEIKVKNSTSYSHLFFKFFIWISIVANKQNIFKCKRSLFGCLFFRFACWLTIVMKDSGKAEGTSLPTNFQNHLRRVFFLEKNVSLHQRKFLPPFLSSTTLCWKSFKSIYFFEKEFNDHTVFMFFKLFFNPYYFDKINSPKSGKITFWFIK